MKYKLTFFILIVFVINLQAGIGVGYSPDKPVGVEPTTFTVNALEYRLEQNYPNPFNPTTVISYTLAEASHVNITVYDILGTEVSTLVNENKQAGSYKVKFDATSLSNGVYFYKIASSNYTSIKKMILLK